MRTVVVDAAKLHRIFENESEKEKNGFRRVGVTFGF